MKRNPLQLRSDLPLESYLRERASEVDSALDRLLPKASVKPATIHRAIRYSLFAGGKRMRPILCLAAAEACAGSYDNAIFPACAVECVHTYSLIHDDLPCMDDDDLRRGRPTSHKVFGEAIAVLAGDALLTAGFEILASIQETAAIPAQRLPERVGVRRRQQTIDRRSGSRFGSRGEKVVTTRVALYPRVQDSSDDRGEPQTRRHGR